MAVKTCQIKIHGAEFKFKTLFGFLYPASCHMNQNQRQKSFNDVKSNQSRKQNISKQSENDAGPSVIPFALAISLEAQNDVLDLWEITFFSPKPKRPKSILHDFCVGHHLCLAIINIALKLSTLGCSKNVWDDKRVAHLKLY